MLLVDHDEAEVPKVDTLLDQRVRAYDQCSRTVRERLQCLLSLRGLQLAREYFDAQAERLHHFSQLADVLLREQLRRRHEDRLPSTLDGQEHREEGDDRLPRPDVPL